MRMKLFVVAVLAVAGITLGTTAASAGTCVGTGLGGESVEVCTP